MKQVLALILGGTLPSLHAQVTVYTSQGAWEAALSGLPIIETFDNPIPQGDRITFDCAVVSEGFNPVSSPFNYVDEGSWHGLVRPTGNLVLPGYESIVWTFPTAVTAVGGDWSSLGLNHGLNITGQFDGISATSFTIRDELGASVGFFGIVGTGAFTTLTLSQASTAPLNEGFKVDNLRLMAVPEHSNAVLAIALVLLVGSCVRPWISGRRCPK